MNSKEKQSNSEKNEIKCEKKEKNKIDCDVEGLKKDLKETKELLLRTAAEYDNFRKRSEREKEAIYSDASSVAVLAVLPLADSLEAAKKASQSGSEEYKKGIKLLVGQMDKSLKALGTEPFGEINDIFDPNIHNAISHKESEEDKQNFISAVYQKGYKMGERIVRHAMVEVTN